MADKRDRLIAKLLLRAPEIEDDESEDPEIGPGVGLCVRGPLRSTIEDMIESLERLRARGHPDGCMHQRCVELRTALVGHLHLAKNKKDLKG